MATDSWIAQLGRRWEERGHDSPAERKSQEAARPINGRDRRLSKEGRRGKVEEDSVSR